MYDKLRSSPCSSRVVAALAYPFIKTRTNKGNLVRLRFAPLETDRLAMRIGSLPP